MSNALRIVIDGIDKVSIAEKINFDDQFQKVDLA